jgi:hypothetical protein
MLDCYVSRSNRVDRSSFISDNKQGSDLMRRIMYRTGTALALVLAWAASTAAQTPDPKGCTPQERSSEALNEDAQTNAGVICPPDVDPAMKAPAPKTGDTPVIPAPGSRGGEPYVQPK